jgi:hypothetical protein
MIDELTLEEAVSLSLRRTLKDAFPGVQVVAWDASEDREKVNVSLRIDSEGENPIGTNIFDIIISIRATNLNASQREILRSMFGSAHAAAETVSAENKGKFAMPQGQPVEILSISHETENQTDRISNIALNASIQPL